MAWIESHASLLGHPKTKELCRLLRLKRRDTVGLLHMLWWWAIEYVPDGDFSEISDAVIAEEVDWNRDPSELVAALTLVGFIDEGRVLHDWQDYAGRWIERRAANAERMRRARAERKIGARGAHVQRTFDERAPDVQGLPNLNRTGPNRTLTGPPPPTPPATQREGGSSLPLADSPGDETGGESVETRPPAHPGTGHGPTNGAGRIKPVLNGRQGWAGCPAGCPTNHGGPMAARHLGEDWLAIPPDERPSWPAFLAQHGRPDLADVPAPVPATQEA